MRILVTGSNGFVGRNLVWNLKELRDGKNGTRPNLTITEIYGYDVGSSQEDLERACARCDFVFHLAGVNRPKEKGEFMEGNYGFASTLLDTLKTHHNTCPVMLSSSIQASLSGRFEDSDYGKSKLAGEELFFRYGEETGTKVLVYRFPNLFGKWCKPNYNSAVATFCNAVANDLDYTVNDRGTELELVYIDDLIEEMLDALEGKEHRCSYPRPDSVEAEGSPQAQSGGGQELARELQKGICDRQEMEGKQQGDVCRIRSGEPQAACSGMEPVPDPAGWYCYVPTSYHVTLGEIVDLLDSFRQMPSTLYMPEIPEGTFAKKLYSTYLTYLPPSKMVYHFRSSVDNRGNFTELIRTLRCGQVSVNVAKPGITRGEHWHNSKWEIFIVVSGHGLIRQRRIGIDPETVEEYPVIEFEVTGEQMKAVQMLPGYTHSIINLSKTENLVTVMWANEPFDPEHPDTFHEPVLLEKGNQMINPEKGNI